MYWIQIICTVYKAPIRNRLDRGSVTVFMYVLYRHESYIILYVLYLCIYYIDIKSYIILYVLYGGGSMQVLL